ncbi:hypothetical protein AAFF_G00438600 [Aldrovandia affinis]|uniref:Myoneurin n=1 Tax=Aldrovandia affinis TaxID=143900 RepID=A0AAD7S7W7_9TELE|nr:hypothetical protein AAFF_G00438600 [Aldrovandia affinis]
MGRGINHVTSYENGRKQESRIKKVKRVRSELAMQALPHGERLLEQLRKQQESGCFCDCTVAIGTSRFRAHRNVLAVFSEYFRSHCQSSAADDVTISLDPEWLNEQVFQKLLDYVYTGDLGVDSDNVEELCKAASFLQMEDVVTLCILLQEDIKPVCVGTMEGCDSQEHEPASLDADSALVTEDEVVEPEQVDQEPPMQEEVPRTRASQRIRKPKVMPDGSILKNCAVVLRRENWHLTSDPELWEAFIDDRNKAPETPASQTPCAVLDEAEWHAPMSTEADSPDEQELPPKRKRGRARKGRFKENRSGAASTHQDDCEEPLLYLKGKPICGICGRAFSESSSVRRHMRIHKGIKPYECQLCNKTFRQGNQLKTHMRIHTGEKPFRCYLCDKSFAQKCQLVFHRRMHHGEEKPYKCDACGLQFATSSNFKIHIRKHSGEKPYECDRCGKHFAQASTLTYHMRRHTGEKPYICDTCGKAFAVSSSLLAHSRKHTGDMSCFCIVCHKTFLSIEELDKHFPCQKGGKRVECDLCEKTYMGAKYLKQHKLKVHNVPSEDPAQLPFSLNIPIDHQALLSRVPPGPGTAQLLTMAAAEAAAAAAAAAAATAADQYETEYVLLQPLN